MLVMVRKVNESIIINNDIVITVIEIRGDKVRLGIQSPAHIPVHRYEVWQAISGPPSALTKPPTLAPAPQTAVPALPAPVKMMVELNDSQVALLDRLCNSIEKKTGKRPTREHTLNAVLEAVDELTLGLEESDSLNQLKELLVLGERYTTKPEA